ncbi:unnamed protein product [Linum tenue]|uniref:Uncharacterized protein n=1 Tax=Linum tenue TaxID=586396 RepID=A0AAV0MT61_9ROSI|nr:unnamed protein product [Linum tenue]
MLVERRGASCSYLLLSALRPECLYLCRLLGPSGENFYIFLGLSGLLPTYFAGRELDFFFFFFLQQPGCWILLIVLFVSLQGSCYPFFGFLSLNS